MAMHFTEDDMSIKDGCAFQRWNANDYMVLTGHAREAENGATLESRRHEKITDIAEAGIKEPNFKKKLGQCTGILDKTPYSPSVFVLKIDESASGSTACLVKDFYPEDVEIYMNSSKQSLGPVKVKPILSLKGKYSAVHVGNLGAEDVHCQAKHQGGWVTERVILSNSEDVDIEKKKDTAMVESVKEDVDIEKNENTTMDESVQTGHLRVNWLSMKILGMRVLFAKMMSFNVITSVKFFVL